jgi:hypothetical protein
VGRSLQSTKVKVADVLVRGLQFTIVVDLVGWNINDFDLTKLDKYFQIVGGELPDKEYARWDPAIVVNRRLEDTSVSVEIMTARP